MVANVIQEWDHDGGDRQEERGRAVRAAREGINNSILSAWCVENVVIESQEFGNPFLLFWSLYSLC
ncbi:hypothetical protein Scep_027705 [Stephania cephalantha]|uniref:Uncharacterized protein n=1 Tax=Stephania cephalantha TaxID=152367 RepID=A0AAP0EBQ0_9MAGN